MKPRELGGTVPARARRNIAVPAVPLADARKLLASACELLATARGRMLEAHLLMLDLAVDPNGSGNRDLLLGALESYRAAQLDVDEAITDSAAALRQLEAIEALGQVTPLEQAR